MLVRVAVLLPLLLLPPRMLPLLLPLPLGEKNENSEAGSAEEKEIEELGEEKVTEEERKEGEEEEEEEEGATTPPTCAPFDTTRQTT